MLTRFAIRSAVHHFAVVQEVTKEQETRVLGYSQMSEFQADFQDIVQHSDCSYTWYIMERKLQYGSNHLPLRKVVL